MTRAEVSYMLAGAMLGAPVGSFIARLFFYYPAPNLAAPLTIAVGTLGGAAMAVIWRRWISDRLFWFRFWLAKK